MEKVAILISKGVRISDLNVWRAWFLKKIFRLLNQIYCIFQPAKGCFAGLSLVQITINNKKKKKEQISSKKNPKGSIWKLLPKACQKTWIKWWQAFESNSQMLKKCWFWPQNGLQSSHLLVEKYNNHWDSKVFLFFAWTWWERKRRTTFADSIKLWN